MEKRSGLFQCFHMYEIDFCKEKIGRLLFYFWSVLYTNYGLENEITAFSNDNQSSIETVKLYKSI